MSCPSIFTFSLILAYKFTFTDTFTFTSISAYMQLEFHFNLCPQIDICLYNATGFANASVCNYMKHTERSPLGVLCIKLVA